VHPTKEPNVLDVFLVESRVNFLRRGVQIQPTHGLCSMTQRKGMHVFADDAQHDFIGAAADRSQPAVAVHP